MNIKLSGTAPVCITPYDNITPDDLANADKKLFHQLTVCLNGAYPSEWTLVGIAHVQIELHDRDVIVDGAVKALRAEAEQVMAEAQAKVTRIEGRIQSLLAITYDEAGK